MPWEWSILYFFQQLHTPVLDQIMIVITHLASKGAFWLSLGVIFLFFKKTRSLGLTMLVSILFSFLIGNLFLKNLVQRLRPYWLDPSVSILVPHLNDYSFPSGHTMVSFSGALPIYYYNKKWGIWSLALATLIALSRLYHFVHFPTDLIGGFLVSFLSVHLAIKILHLFESKKGL